MKINLLKQKLFLITLIGKDVSAKIKLNAKSFNSKKEQTVEPLVKEINVKKGKSHIEIIYPMGENVQLWDEFNPALYKMTAVLSDESGNTDEREIQFGMRSFSINGTRFEINNRPVFLRGNC